MPEQKNASVDEYIQNAVPEQKSIMERVRELIHEVLPDVREDFKWSRPIFGTQKDFAYLKTSKAYVTLGFYSVANLRDPDQILEGTGKDMRHIKLRSAADINEPLLREWLQTFSNQKPNI